VLIELKRDRTPREIVARALNYALSVNKPTADRTVQIHGRFIIALRSAIPPW
jgi:hypothetical protein